MNVALSPVGFCVIGALCVSAFSGPESASSSAHCERPPKVLQSRQDEIRGTNHHNWAYHPTNCTWVIAAPEEQPVILSFSQFSIRCGSDWVSVTSSTGRQVSLCGSQLPKPFELTGNVTVTHHFLPRFSPPYSGFRLAYTKASLPCTPVEFECLNGRCLPLSWHCNGQVECMGEEDYREDEQECDYEAGRVPGTTATAPPPATTPAPSSDAPPGVDLEVNHASQDGTCGGVLRNFYGSFGPSSSLEPPQVCVWTVDPQDPRLLRVELQMLELGPGDSIVITDNRHGAGSVIKTITCVSNYKVVEVESRTGLLSLTYHLMPASEGQGFNATYRVTGYCLPWEHVCGGSLGGCYATRQQCDGRWDCPETGRDEEGCGGCDRGQFPCGLPGVPRTRQLAGRPFCYTLQDHCNYQLNCADGSDERDCLFCRPGTFHCDTDRCVFESWRCDGQMDCKDGTDELNCTVALPRKVITAATVGSLVCGLLLVIAMGCTCKLYSLRTREYSMFAPISRQEAELIQQQAPPSYGQLIAQGVIPPVEDFPTENPNETASLSLRGILQLLRQDAGSSPHRRRRPRFVRRALRRMRRWGLLPRSAPRPPQNPSSGPQQSEAPPAGPEQSQARPEDQPLARDDASQPLPQKQGLLRHSAEQQQQQQQAPPTPAPPLPALPPTAVQDRPQSPPQTPPLTSSPSSSSSSSSSLATVFQFLGMNLSLFRHSPPSSTSLPLSSSPSSSSSEDEVLLIPLSEDATSDDDVPMLT
ncbi:low-density lipoprotein receptor-related protein 10 [Denticeps clupeoides]|uniref:CUB domain-containing protein n=1 Tax=Denticeps clupeoides TaxID=299321 RepID=A0AAY4A1S9_9TELE|nr:low-density lipoprotein receptor-related protein 10 [Denticeps clupeoides]XP_028850929.1 low-density lipoprotein receptor-related protein 10 [Denticeps clupeoides]